MIHTIQMLRDRFRSRRFAILNVLVVATALAAADQSAEAQTRRISGRLTPIIENIALISGREALGNAILIDCLQTTVERKSCVMLAPSHILEAVKGESVTVTVASGHAVIKIREPRLIHSAASPEAPIGLTGPLELLVAQHRVPVLLSGPRPQTLVSIRDAINALSSQSLVFADITGTADPTPRFTLRLMRHESIESANVPLALRESGRDLLAEQPLWSVPKKDIDLAIIQVEVPSEMIRVNLNDDALADNNTLQQTEAGDQVLCLGFDLGQRMSTGFPGVRGGFIYAPLSPAPTFLIDTFVTPGKSGGPCISVPSAPEAKSQIVGIILGELQYPDGQMVQIPWPINLAVALKATIVKEVVGAFKRTVHRPATSGGI